MIDITPWTRAAGLILMASFAAAGCRRELQLADQPFESGGPLSRVHPIKVRVFVEATAEQEQKTNIPPVDSWTSVIALAVAANGHDVAIGGPMPPRLQSLGAALGIPSERIHPDRADSELDIRVTGYAAALYKVDFPYADHMGEAYLTVEIRPTKTGANSLIRTYGAHAMARGRGEVVKEAQQWCVWDLIRDPEVVRMFARATVD